MLVPGGDLSLNCSASGEPTPTISWKRSMGAWNNERMTAQRGTLPIFRLDETDSGIYICEAKVPYYNIDAKTNLVVSSKWLS